MSKNEEIKTKSVTDLVSMLDELTKEQVALRLQKSVGQQVARHRFRIIRRNIARVKMYLHLHTANA